MNAGIRARCQCGGHGRGGQRHNAGRDQYQEDFAMTVKATPTPGRLLISPTDHVLVLIDHQSQMAFATKSIDGALLRINVSLISHAAQVFDVDTILTTVATESFSGPIFTEI